MGTNFATSELQRHPWILRDIPFQTQWLRETAPERHGAVSVSADDETVALSVVKFRWKDRLAARLSSFIFGKQKRLSGNSVGASRTGSRLRPELRVEGVPAPEATSSEGDLRERQPRSATLRGGPTGPGGRGRPRIVTRNLSKGRTAARSAMGRFDHGTSKKGRKASDKHKSTSDLPLVVPSSPEHSRERDVWGMTSTPSLGIAHSSPNVSKRRSLRRSLSRKGRRRGGSFVSSTDSPTTTSDDQHALSNKVRSRMSLTFYKHWKPRWPGSGARSPLSAEDRIHTGPDPPGFASVVERRSADEIMAISQPGGISSSRGIIPGISMRASSWGEFAAEGRQIGVYDDAHTDIFSDDDSDFDLESLGGYADENDNYVMMVGAGGVLSPPGSPPSGTGSSVSLTANKQGSPSMGEAIYSSGSPNSAFAIGGSPVAGPSGGPGGVPGPLLLPAGLLAQKDHLFHPADTPVEPNPALLETIGHEQHRGTRQHALSPLAQTPYVLDDRDISVFGDELAPRFSDEYPSSGSFDDEDGRGRPDRGEREEEEETEQRDTLAHLQRLRSLSAQRERGRSRSRVYGNDDEQQPR